MRIWIDADACPRPVKDIIFRAGQRTSNAVSVVANKAMYVPPSDLISMIQVPGGSDVADDYIVEHAERGDIAITADIPLAARLVERNVVTLDSRGEEYCLVPRSAPAEVGLHPTIRSHIPRSATVRCG